MFIGTKPTIDQSSREATCCARSSHQQSFAPAEPETFNTSQSTNISSSGTVKGALLKCAQCTLKTKTSLPLVS